MRTTRTVATLDVSSTLYREVRDKLTAAGYDHAFMPDGAIDMHGIALTEDRSTPAPLSTPPPLHFVPALGAGGRVSSNVSSFAYDASAETLVVRFHNHTAYRYAPVPIHVVLQFAQSESKGQFLAREIKPLYPADRLEDWS